MSEEVHLNLSGVDFTLEPLEPGTYNAVVSDIAYGPAKSSGAPNIAWTFIVQDPPFEGRKLFMNTSLQKQALWKLGQTLLALGFDAKDLGASGGFDLNPMDLLEAPCRVVVTQREFEGTIRSQVTKILPATKETSMAIESAAKAQEIPF